LDCRNLSWNTTDDTLREVRLDLHSPPFLDRFGLIRFFFF
jgi:hypothetical protein